MRHITWINLIVGLWLVVAPFAVMIPLSQSPGTTSVLLFGNDILIGLLLIGSSLWIVFGVAPPASAAGFQVLCGAWLIIFGLVFYRHFPPELVNHLVSGIVAIAIGWVMARRLVGLVRPLV
jgi:hypothetical protein